MLFSEVHCIKESVMQIKCLFKRQPKFIARENSEQWVVT